MAITSTLRCLLSPHPIFSQHSPWMGFSTKAEELSTPTPVLQPTLPNRPGAAHRPRATSVGSAELRWGRGRRAERTALCHGWRRGGDPTGARGGETVVHFHVGSNRRENTKRIPLCSDTTNVGRAITRFEFFTRIFHVCNAFYLLLKKRSARFCRSPESET